MANQIFVIRPRAWLHLNSTDAEEDQSVAMAVNFMVAAMF